MRVYLNQVGLWASLDCLDYLTDVGRAAYVSAAIPYTRDTGLCVCRGNRALFSMRSLFSLCLDCGCNVTSRFKLTPLDFLAVMDCSLEFYLK